MSRYLLAGIMLVTFTRCALGLELADYRLVELTHPYNAETIYWPTSPSRFELTKLAFGDTKGGWFYSANTLSTPEHGGTHLDAPIHFSANGNAVHEIPLENLIGPAVLIDITEKTHNDPNYRLSVADVRAFEAQHGVIVAGTIVLLRTGWSERWPDTAAYLGDATPGDASHLAFPSFGEDAARLLVEERGVVLLGVDTASIDYGASKDFPVHRITGAKNVAGLENLTGLEQLPPDGFTLLALPMLVEGGSGAPVRAVALVSDD